MSVVKVVQSTYYCLGRFFRKETRLQIPDHSQIFFQFNCLFFQSISCVCLYIRETNRSMDVRPKTKTIKSGSTQHATADHDNIHSTSAKVSKKEKHLI